MKKADLVVIGGGPAGMAAALAAWEAGVRDILILERGNQLGGILNQCIHSGFGLHAFQEELTGPEYAERYAEMLQKTGVGVELATLALDLSGDRRLQAVNRKGLLDIQAGAVVLAMGCRERPRGALGIPGSRPSGVLTAGTAQKFVNLDGRLPGDEAVILGSGDIGLIMARRLTLEGMRVKAVVERLPHPGGLRRNVVQCLDDFGIPLLLSHAVVRIRGRRRLTGVDIAPVDGNLSPRPDGERGLACDTLLLSAGLIPENELSRQAGIEISPLTGGPLAGESLQTSAPGVFACGNALHVHDLADFASEEGAAAGRHAAAHLAGRLFPLCGPSVIAGEGVRYAMPARVAPDRIGDGLRLRFRTAGLFRDCSVAVWFDRERVLGRPFRILVPGEMESVFLDRRLFEAHPGLTNIRVAVERECACPAS